MKHWLTFVDFLKYLHERFSRDQCSRAAASLAFTSVLALVPLFTVVFVTLSAFPAFQQWQEAIESFIFQNFVPALGAQVRGYLVEFSTKAKGLQAFGIAILFVTVLSMMSTIDSTFNVIWRIKRQRPLIVRFLVYWAVLTLGPILIGTSILITSYLVSLPFVSSSVTSLGLQSKFLSALPMVATTTAFVMFFKLIPYRPVPFRHALIGALTASCLFEATKRIFAFYVINFPSQEAVYGAFATVPIFLLWIYLCWVIVLLGAEVTQCLTTYSAVSSRKRSSIYRNPIYVSFRVLLRLFLAQQAGSALSDKSLLQLEPNLGYDAINKALEELDAAKWISRNDSFEWVLVRDLHRETMVELMQISPMMMQSNNVTDIRLDEADYRFLQALDEYNEWLRAEMALPLAQIITTAKVSPEDLAVNPLSG
jgi:membrane protein